jgi:DivIVA domain-containing protein
MPCAAEAADALAVRFALGMVARVVVQRQAAERDLQHPIVAPTDASVTAAIPTARRGVGRRRDDRTICSSYEPLIESPFVVAYAHHDAGKLLNLPSTCAAPLQQAHFVYPSRLDIARLIPSPPASECGAPVLTPASFHSDGWAVEMPVRLSGPLRRSRNTAEMTERDRELERQRKGPRGQTGERAPTVPLAGHVPSDVRDVSFHTSVRGYERREVDRYVQRVNRVIAELEIARSPESAVRHALDRVGEQTSGILQRARETADEIIHTARSEAEEVVARGNADAQELVATARTQAEGILADAETEAGERAEQGERELAAARKQAEEARAEADATVADASARAEDIAAKARTEAEQIVTRADSQAIERRGREEQKLEELRRQAKQQVEALRADADAIADERGRLAEGIRELAARLEALADEAGPRPRQESELADGDHPAGAQPESAEAAQRGTTSSEQAPNKEPDG